MRAAEAALALTIATGAPRESVERAQIAVARDAYVHDTISLARFEQLVEHALAGRGIVAMLQPGERVIPMGMATRGELR